MEAGWLETIRPIFRQARKDLYYPPILRIEAGEVETSEISFSGPRSRLLVGREVCRKFSNEALLGIFQHELNHWARHPYDLKTLILESYWLGEIGEKETIRNLFDDVVVNLDLVVNRGLPQVARAYGELRPGSDLDRLLRSFYSRVTGLDFGGTPLRPELEERVARLCTIDFLDLDRVRLRGNLRRFAGIIEDLLVEEPVGPFSFFSLTDFRPEEITRALGAIAGEVEPREYRQIAAAAAGDLKDSALPNSEILARKGGMSPGEKHLVDQLGRPEISWYRSRARRYSISIETLVKKGSPYPEQITDFELDDGIDRFNPVESYGKILPSLAKKHDWAEFERFGVVAVPDVIMILDSSGSMPNPDEALSYAVLGAFAIARNYFELGARVGVVNFSNANLELAPTRDRQAAYEMLKTYQGHGTTLHLDDLDRYVGNLGDAAYDYILITDAGIDNFEKVAEYFASLKGRLSIVWLKSESESEARFEANYQRFKKELPASVSFCEVARERDIPALIVGKALGGLSAID